MDLAVDYATGCGPRSLMKCGEVGCRVVGNLSISVTSENVVVTLTEVRLTQYHPAMPSGNR